MSMRQGHWAIVLAAGDGTRLAALTTDEGGGVVPKQFCSLNGSLSLLQLALERAQRIVPRERVCVIVARQHQNRWSRDLWSLPAQNVIVQPRNCGWTDLGTPQRVIRALQRFQLAPAPSVNAPQLTAASLDLRARSSSEVNLGLRYRERFLITS